MRGRVLRLAYRVGARGERVRVGVAGDVLGRHGGGSVGGGRTGALCRLETAR